MKQSPIHLSKILLFFSFIILVFLMPTLCLADEADGFDFPANKPNGLGYKNGSEIGGTDGWGYLEFNGSVFHPGEDWNKGYGDDDYGDNLFSITSGEVIESRNYGGNWGKVVLVRHRIADGGYLYSQYAHLSYINVKNGDKVNRGSYIGDIGNAEGRWASHLHFEIREKEVRADFWPQSNWTKPKVEKYYVNPSEFIKSHRPKPPVVAQELVAEVTTNGVLLSWDENTSKEFSKFEIYRSEVSGGTKNTSSRTLLETITEQSVNEYIDESKLLFDKEYYYSVAVYEKDGRSALSNEAHIKKKREVINLTQSPTLQKAPKIGAGKVIWEDMSYENSRFPYRRTLHYYNIATRELGEIKIGSSWERIEGPYSTEIINNWFCYLGKTSHYANSRVYCHDIEQGVDIPLTETSIGDEAPVLSEMGYVVWSRKNRLYFTNINGTAEVEVVHESEEPQMNYRVWKNLVSWREKEGSSYKLIVKNLETGDVVYEENSFSDSSPADISGSWLTWYESGKVVAYNHQTQEEVVVSENSDGGTPRISGEKIVYETINEGFRYLNVFDLGTRKNMTIDFPLYWSASPYIYEDVLVFQAPTEPTSDMLNSMDIWLTWL